MKYLLDFDRTLFNSDTYNTYLHSRPAMADLAHEFADVFRGSRDTTKTPSPGRMAFWDRVSGLIKTGALSYADGELTPFLYEDVIPFLTSHQGDVAIVTFGERALQEAKILSALPKEVQPEILYAEGDLKGDFLATDQRFARSEAVFVDDLAEHLLNIRARVPTLRLYEMRRDGKEGSGQFPVIRSLTELP